MHNICLARSIAELIFHHLSTYTQYSQILGNYFTLNMNFSTDSAFLLIISYPQIYLVVGTISTEFLSLLTKPMQLHTVHRHKRPRHWKHMLITATQNCIVGLVIILTQPSTRFYLGQWIGFLSVSQSLCVWLYLWSRWYWLFQNLVVAPRCFWKARFV